ncbi:AAA family ATPase [Psychromonas hadalis]|uniref:AAA family ATPase n=1 Tax=Psychromonas hadalis TaxID=211669 RepID=UPI0003B7B786|nr:AAA family ATPase [Psychromonas hadalis]
MEKNIFKIPSLANVQAETSLSLQLKNELQISLPILINSLLVCADPNLSAQLSNVLKGVKHLLLKTEHKITFVNTEVNIILLVFCGDENTTATDIEKCALKNIPTILIGDNIPALIMRKAVQYHIKDIVPLTPFNDEIGPVLITLVNEISVNMKMAPVVSIINGKGGSGASFITDCLGQICAQKSDDKIVLFDGDFQHGSLADILGVEPQYYLSDALKEVEKLDALSIQSMMCSNNNLSLLPVKPYSHLSDSVQINIPELSLLMNKIRSNFQLVIADFSRGLDHYSLPIIDISEIIFVVVQQNIVSIREAKALITYMRARLGIEPQRIHLIINRFSKKQNTLSINDIKDAIGIKSAFIIHNNYELASACTDLGKRIGQVHDAKQIKTDIGKIVVDLMPISLKKGKHSSGFWSRFMGN